MDGKLRSDDMMVGRACYDGGICFQGSAQFHHQQEVPSVQPQNTIHKQGSKDCQSICKNLSFSTGRMQEGDQVAFVADYGKGEIDGKVPAGNGGELNTVGDAGDDRDDGCRGKGTKLSPWHRVKWTNEMVRLMITAVSYIGEDAVAEYDAVSRRKYANLHQKGKWRTISKVMAERGHFVSPQQCEDKFNDLNKKYKRLNEILGRGTSCEIVEDNTLLEVMDHIPEKAKEEVRKILSSKQLHYEEMCSYHNGNHLHLPPDPELQYSLQLALRGRDDHDNNNVRKYSRDEGDRDTEIQDSGELVDKQTSYADQRELYGVSGGSTKRVKQFQCLKNMPFGKSSSLDCKNNQACNSQPQGVDVNMDQAYPAGTKENMLQTQWWNHRKMQLEEHKLQLQAQMLELEKERHKWHQYCRKRDEDLEMMRIENERMKLENEHMALELKSKEMDLVNN